MKALRFVALTATLVAGYFAQYIVDHASLADLFPQWLVNMAPSLTLVMRWLPADLDRLALGCAVIGALLFGLIIPAWPGSPGLRVLRRVEGQHPAHRLRLTGLVCLAGAVLLAGSVLFMRLGQPRQESLWLQLFWLASALLLLVSSDLLDRQKPQRLAASEAGRPERTWPWLLVILAIAGALFAWNWIDLPQRIAPEVAQLAAQAQTAAAAGSLFNDGSAGAPGLATLFSALWIGVSGDTLTGMHLAALMVGMALVAATWLLACELFRRLPARGAYDLLIEDDGGSVALLAALIMATLAPMLHFSRIPVLLEPILWGVLALWALLRAGRVGSYFALSLSGLLTAMAFVLTPTGRTFLVVLGLLWVGLWLLRRSWLSWQEGGVGLPGLGLWLLAFALLAAPWIGAASTWQVTMSAATSLLDRLWPTLLAFNGTADASTLVGYPAPLLVSLIAPVFILAIGGLLGQLDSLVGWTLLSWLGAAVVMSAWQSPVAPAWPTLLPALPAAALILAFGFDRIRSTLTQTLGSWTTGATLYLAFGVVILAALFTWTGYYRFAWSTRDDASAIARAARAADPGTPLALVAVPAAPDWSNAVVVTIAGARATAGVTLSQDATSWPSSLPPMTRILVLPDNQEILAMVRTRYPGGVLKTERNRSSNPTLFIYQLP